MKPSEEIQAICQEEFKRLQIAKRCHDVGVHMELSVALKRCRKFKNATQKQVSEGIGITEQAYQRYEYGKTTPSALVLIALADYFDVSLDYLVGRCDNPQSHKPFKIVDDSDEALEEALAELKKELDKI